MRKFLLLTIIFLNLGPLFAEDEILAVENLIVVTESQLQKQKELKNLIVLFEQQKQLFMKGDQSKSLAGRLLKNASQILSLVKENHLQHLFPSEYMEELALFSSMAAKKRPVAP